MSFWETALIGVGLAMDAFAVATTNGLKMKKFNISFALTIALFFGLFQMIMPFLGWVIGRSFASYIESIDHWIAFALLMFLGIKMIVDSFKKEKDDGEWKRPGFVQLTVMAVATSIDAFAVGVTFSFGETNILSAIAIIGVITFVLSFTGAFFGYKIGEKLKNRADILGGIILILIGIKILLEGLEVISF